MAADIIIITTMRTTPLSIFRCTSLKSCIQKVEAECSSLCSVFNIKHRRRLYVHMKFIDNDDDNAHEFFLLPFHSPFQFTHDISELHCIKIYFSPLSYIFPWMYGTGENRSLNFKYHNIKIKIKEGTTFPNNFTVSCNIVYLFIRSLNM